MLYLGYGLLRYVLIYNLEVSFNFHLTFLQLNVIKMFTAQQKLFFTLLSATFFELPISRIGMLCMNQRNLQTILGGSKTHASLKNRTMSERNEFSI